MKPNATSAVAEPTTDETEDQAAPLPAEPTPTPTQPTAVPVPVPVPVSTEAANAEAANAMAVVRTEAAELATIGAQAARLGLSIELAEAVQNGIKPDALRASVLNQLAARSDAAAITVVPSPKSAAPESPIIAAARKAAADAKR